MKLACACCGFESAILRVARDALKLSALELFCPNGSVLTAHLCITFCHRYHHRHRHVFGVSTVVAVVVEVVVAAVVVVRSVVWWWW